MKNAIQRGDNIDVVAPYDVSSGDGLQVGDLFGAAMSDALTGEPVVMVTVGVLSMTAKSADVAAVGAKVYWDNTLKQMTTTATSNTLIGAATVAKTSGETEIAVRLNV